MMISLEFLYSNFLRGGLSLDGLLRYFFSWLKLAFLRALLGSSFFGTTLTFFLFSMTFCYSIIIDSSTGTSTFSLVMWL